MASELGKISIYLAKDGKSFDDVIDEDKLPNESDSFKVREFEVDGHSVRFYCKHAVTVKPENPPWLEFVNEKLDVEDQKIHFDSYSKRPRGLLLIEIENRTLAASFGIGGSKGT